VTNASVVATVSRLSGMSLGVFRGSAAVRLGVTRKQIGALVAGGVVERLHPDTYRMTVVPASSEQALRAALMWAGDQALAAGRSAGEMYELDGVRAGVAEIIGPPGLRARGRRVIVHRSDDRASMMARCHRGIAVTGVEPTLLSLAHTLDGEAFEVACEDARRRRLTSVSALRAYLERFGSGGRPGARQLQSLLDQLDPRYASRSKLEVKTRRLLVAHGVTDFVRELPLAWNGCTYRYDFGFERQRTILEINGRRWHDDPSDYEHDNEKWSVPGRHGYRIVFATWDKVTRHPRRLLHELAATSSHALVG
jgi:very-short-patch-repair endonuclease